MFIFSCLTHCSAITMTGELLIHIVAFFRDTECEHYWDFSFTYLLSITYIPHNYWMNLSNYENMSPQD